MDEGTSLRYQILHYIKPHNLNTELPKYYARLQMTVVRGLSLPAGRLAGRHTDAAPKHSLISVQFPISWSHTSMYICKAEKLPFTDCDYCQTLVLLLLSVVIVIIVIFDMPRQEFSLCERVCIHNTYMKSRKSCSETRRKFRVKFPGRPVPNPSTIRRQAKRFKEKNSVKNRKVNRRRHVLIEETL